MPPSLLVAVRGLAYEVRPVPTAAAVGAALAGAALAPGALGLTEPLLLIVAGVVLSLYIAHVVDSHVDYHVRDEEKYRYMGVLEDSGGLLGPRTLLGAAGVATAVHLVVDVRLLVLGETELALLALAGLGLGWGHSTLFDRRWWTGTFDYPAGVTAAFLAGNLALAPGLPAPVVPVALTFFAYLAGAKVVSDLIDEEDDRRIRKRTLPVVLGGAAAKRLGYAVCIAALAAAVAVVALTPLPAWLFAVLAASAVLLVVSWRPAPGVGVLVLVAGGYVYVAGLLAVGLIT